MPTTSASRIIDAPRDEVWAALSDLANATRWNSAWSRIEFSSTQTHGPGTRFRAHTEDGSAYEFMVSAWVAPEYIEFSPIRDETERYGIMLESHAFHLLPEGDYATRIELIARSSTHGLRGWVVGLFFWRGYQKRGLHQALDTLGSLFDGQEPEPPEERQAADIQ